VKNVTLSAVINPEDSGFVALCPELDIASQGSSIDEALTNLKEAVEGFFEVANSVEIEHRLKKPVIFTHFQATRT
jgi:predicted RNase H-like HicB family nuclease